MPGMKKSKNDIPWGAYDSFREPMKKTGKKQVTRGAMSAKAGYADAAEVGWKPSPAKKKVAKKSVIDFGPR